MSHFSFGNVISFNLHVNTNKYCVEVYSRDRDHTRQISALSGLLCLPHTHPSIICLITHTHTQLKVRGHTEDFPCLHHEFMSSWRNQTITSFLQNGKKVAALYFCLTVFSYRYGFKRVPAYCTTPCYTTQRRESAPLQPRHKRMLFTCTAIKYFPV